MHNDGPRVGLVLGAGGTVGIAWMVGALAALERETGWEPTAADVIAGTSAGSVVACVLAAGLDPASLLRMAEDPGALERAIAAATSGREHLRPQLAWPGSLALGLTGLLTADAHHRLTSLAGFLPRGLRSTSDIRGLTHAAVRHGWPVAERPRLWLNTCDYKTGRRVIFGRDPDAPEADLADAVAASCAVPAYYAPVRIGGRLYADGGLWSFTNADALAPEDLDVVIVLSPTSSFERGSALDTAVMGPVRAAVGARLKRECEILRAAGIEVVVIEPGAAGIDAMGLNPMNISRARRIIEAADAEVAANLGPIAGLPRAPKRALALA